MKIQDSHDDDAINVAPELHSVLYEDDALRVLKVTVPGGAHADMHWHPRNINYVVKGGNLKFTKQDCTFIRVNLQDGQITSATEDTFHAVDNEGDVRVETIQVELKSS